MTPKIHKVEIPPRERCTVVVSTWVPERLCNELRSLAEVERVPLSTYIRKALEAYVTSVMPTGDVR